MFKILLKHFIYDIALNIMFDAMYRNIIIPQIKPILDGTNIILIMGNIEITLYNVTSDIIDRYASSGDLIYKIISSIIFKSKSDAEYIIKNEFGINCTIKTI